jgi:neutral ceramidase
MAQERRGSQMTSQLYVGAAKSNITPKLGSHMQGSFADRVAEDVYDELYAQAVVLQNEQNAIAIVVCDVIGLYKRHVDMAKERAAELTGIPAENIFISATHTHYGPNTLELAHLPHEAEYTEWAMAKTADAVKLAHNRLQAARVGHASGSCPEETRNRRWQMKDGTVQMNPGYQNLECLRPAGPTDPEVAVSVFIGEDSLPIAAITNYSLHYVSSPASNTISANYFGAFGRALQRIAGSEFVAIMANGCCGNINNPDVTRPAPPMPHPHYQVERVASVVAARAYAAWQQIREYDTEPVLGAITEMVDFRRRESSEEELARARELYESKNDPADRDWIYALEAVKVAELPLVRPVPVMGIRIGDLGIVGVPGEMFVEYGLQIKAQSPFARTMTIELANDFVGYCPTDVGLEEGGYETWLCRWAMAAPGTEAQMVAAGLNLLEELALR